MICFESAFGPLVRDSVRKGAQALVVSTNNRSYRRSGNSEQHLAKSQMRAAETGRPVLQASVSGISAVIDPDGTVHDTTRPVRERHRAGHHRDDHGRDAVRALRRLDRRAARVARARRDVHVAVGRRRRWAVVQVASSLTAAHQPDDHDHRAQHRRASGAGPRARRPARRSPIRPRRSRRPPRRRRPRTRTRSRPRRWRSSASTFFTPLSRCRSIGDEDPEQREQDHALRGAEVAAVHAGEEDPDPQLDAAVLHRPWCAARPRSGSGGAARSRATQAPRISTGTTASNTELGSVSSSTAPVMPPSSDAEPRIITRCRWPPAPGGSRRRR